MIANYKISEHPIAHAVAPKSANNNETFSFSGFGLDNENILITDFQGLHDAGASDFHDVGNINADGGKFISRWWRKKTFTISGILKAKTAEEMENVIDNFKKSFNEKEGIFRWKYAGEKYREISATASAIDFDRNHYHITFVPFTLTLQINDVYWRERRNIKKFTESGRFVAEIGVDGNVPSEVQIVVLVNSGNMETLTAEKDGKKISVQTAGKQNIIIDSKKKMVKMDGKISDYSGVHFALEPWRNEIIFDFMGNFEADIYVKYDTNYL